MSFLRLTCNKWQSTAAIPALGNRCKIHQIWRTAVALNPWSDRERERERGIRGMIKILSHFKYISLFGLHTIWIGLVCVSRVCVYGFCVCVCADPQKCRRSAFCLGGRWQSPCESDPGSWGTEEESNDKTTWTERRKESRSELGIITPEWNLWLTLFPSHLSVGFMSRIQRYLSLCIRFTTNLNLMATLA